MIRFQFRDPNIWCGDCRRTKNRARFVRAISGDGLPRFIGECPDCDGRCVAQTSELNPVTFRITVSV